MVDSTTKYILVGVYSVLIIAIFVVLYQFITNSDKTIKSTPLQPPNIPVPDQPIPVPYRPIPHPHGPFPDPKWPIQPTNLIGPSDSYFFRDKTFNNKAQTPCMRDLIEKFRQLANPLKLIFADKGTYIQPVSTNDRSTIRATWKRLCNAINTGIKTCPDMRVRYIVPQGANEQIEFTNKNGVVSIPDGVRFHCEDTRLPPIYFRLNHKGAGVTFAINIPDFS